jgi:hypothetical protein
MKDDRGRRGMATRALHTVAQHQARLLDGGLERGLIGFQHEGSSSMRRTIQRRPHHQPATRDGG